MAGPTINAIKEQSNRRILPSLSFAGAGLVRVNLSFDQGLLLFGSYILSFFAVVLGTLGALSHGVSLLGAAPVMVAAYLMLKASNRQRHGRKQLLLSPRGVSLTAGETEIAAADWEQIKSIRAGGGRRGYLTLEGEEGNVLLTAQTGALPAGILSQIVSMMAARGSCEVLLEADKSQMPRGTQRARFAQSVGGLAIGLPFFWLAISQSAADRGTLPMVLATALGCCGIVYGGLNLIIAVSWQSLFPDESQTLTDFRGTPVPYLLWIWAGEAVPGERSFQYASRHAPTDVKRMIRTNQVLALIALALFGVFAWWARTVVPIGKDYLTYTVVGLFALVPFLIMLASGAEHRRIKQVERNLLDEVVISDDQISVWHEGQLQPVALQAPPKVTPLKGPYMSDLTLRLEDRDVEFDAKSMQVLA